MRFFNLKKRHHYWLLFWKIHINPENFIFLHFWDSLGQNFPKWPYFWAFERKKNWPKNYFFFYEKTKFWSFYIKISVCSVVGLKNINVMCVRFIWMVTKPTKTTLFAKTTSTTLTEKPKVTTNPRVSLDMDETLNFDHFNLGRT